MGIVPLDLNSVPGDQVVSVALSRLAGDWDGDGDVDLIDFAQLAACATGPSSGALGPGCIAFDFNSDQSVDLVDMATFLELFNP